MSEAEAKQDRGKTLAVAALRLAAYLAIVLAIAASAIGVLPGTQLSIAVFAVAVVLLSLAMPALRFEIDGGLVDTLYYTAGVLAAVMYFIAAEPEQTVVRLETTLDGALRDKGVSQAALEGLNSVVATTTAALAENAQALAGIDATLSEDWATRLQGDQNALRLIQSVEELEAFAARVTGEEAQCRERLDTFANVQASAQRQELNRPLQPEVSQGIRDPADVQAMIDLETERCRRIFVMQARIEGLAPGYEQVAGLAALSNEAPLTAALSGRAPPATTLTAERAEIEAVVRLVDLRAARAAATAQRTTLSEELRKASADMDAETAALEALDTTITDTDAALVAEKGRPLAGTALRAKAWMTLWWPYVLIAFLGLKLARKPVVILRRK